MAAFTILLIFVAGLLLGFGLCWFVLRARESAHERLKESFAALSHQSLNQSNEVFLQLAKAQFADPFKESLCKLDHHIRELEVARMGAYKGLQQQLVSLSETQAKLATETQSLSRALHAPTSRGRWGEIQLRRIVELAGMLAHCDFDEQTTTDSAVGPQRPDMVVRLPADKCIVVDSKVPLRAYLQAMETQSDDELKVRMKEHAQQLRQHIVQLSKKSYWKNFAQTPEFVVMFLPGDMFLSAAFQTDPTLLEFGVEQGVILATPTTLIALLKAVAFGWRQESMAQNAEAIRELARTLYERLGTVSDHIDKLGRNLRSSVDSYNQAVGSLESRVLVTLRKMQELGGQQNDSAKTPAAIETTTRSLTAPELMGDR